MTSHMETIINAYKTLSKIPSIVGGRLNNSGTKITAKWSVRNLDKGKSTPYLIDYILDSQLNVITKSDFGIDISNELLSAVSPKENFKAIIREEKDGKDKKSYLEVWSKNCLVHSIDLTALDLHGDVYADSEFGCLDWAPDEKSLVYVAEKKKKKSEPFIKRKPNIEDEKKDQDKQNTPGEEYLFKEDWGEQLVGKIQTVIVLCHVETEAVSILKGLPEHWCPGQVRFSPDGESVVGVAWELEKRRLGLIFCTNRPGHIFNLTIKDGVLSKLSTDGEAVRAPRFGPTGDLVWLQRSSKGPHHACHKLLRISSDVMNNLGSVSLNAETTSVTVDIVNTERKISNGETFYGLYNQSLPSKCFSTDGKRLVLSTQQQNEVRSYVVHIESGEIVDISNKEFLCSTSVLCVQNDVILATCSNLKNPGQLYVAKLPQFGHEEKIKWSRISEPAEVPTSLNNSEVSYMFLEQKDTTDNVKSFTAIYFGPKDGKNIPLIVWPHGGPHSAFSNVYLLEAAFFNMLGFACLLVNYRGSTGSGEDSVNFLPSRVGTADVSDCKLATMKAIDKFPVDANKMVLCGGSHGGFLVTHLSGQHPDLYKAVVARNPVIDLCSMINTTDIPDWCAVEIGLPFTEEGPDSEEKLLSLRRCSPITHAHKVKAPTALMLGSNDKRVPYYQGLEYSRRLKANGVPTRVYMYEDNHSLSSLPAEMDNLINGADWLLSAIKQ